MFAAVAMMAAPAIVVITFMAFAAPPVVAAPAIVPPAPVVLALFVTAVTVVAAPAVMPVVIIDLRDVTIRRGAAQLLRHRASRRRLSDLGRHDKNRD
jgi:hypothetical protein